LTALLASILVVIVMTAVIVAYAKRRPVGTPVTWGEAFAGALFVFLLFLFAYAIVPSVWLNYAGGPLKWRSDKIGIPLGPLHHWRVDWGAPHKHHLFTLNLLRNHHRYAWGFPVDNGVLWPHGLTFFGRGKITLTAQNLGDIVATMFYVVFVGGQIYLWSFWQGRGKRKIETPELTTSSYGRPLVRKA